jgi:predicted neuraminidase
MFGLVAAAPLPAAPQAENAPHAPVYSKQLGSPADGRFRSLALPGLEEAYLTPVFASSHAANLLMLKSGDLLCVWFSGSWEGNSDVGIMMARLPKGSKQWSKPQRIDHHPGKSYQNPVLFQAPDGALWLIHTTQPAGQGQANAKVLVTKSADGGKTWTTPAVLFDQPGAFVRQPLVTVSNGDWMLPMYFTPSRGITTGAETNYSVVKISGDQGTHWKDCAIPDSNGYVQPNVVRLQNGRYLAFFRSRYADYIYKSTSNDGCTWTAPQKTQLPNNNSSIQVAKLANGHLAMAFNNAGSVVTKGKPQAGPRKPLSVALSEDGGETWGWVRDLETGIARAGELPPDPIQKDKPGREEYSYPSILQAADGKINVAYTYRRLTIKIVRFDENWMKMGTTSGTFTGDSTK